MKTVLDKLTRDGLINRISTLSEKSTPQWGKMNVYQMLKHCTLVEEMYQGKKEYPRVLLGRLIGKVALKGLLKDESPMGRNAPTGDAFKINEQQGDIAAEKKKWMELVAAYADYTNPGLVHWFFGPMTKEQVGYLVYKHTDHHLRQFNS